MADILVTCPPMLVQIDRFYAPAAEKGLTLHATKVTQVLSVPELLELVPQYDGWIIGDGPSDLRRVRSWRCRQAEGRREVGDRCL